MTISILNLIWIPFFFLAVVVRPTPEWRVRERERQRLKTKKTWTIRKRYQWRIKLLNIIACVRARYIFYIYTCSVFTSIHFCLQWDLCADCWSVRRVRAVHTNTYIVWSAMVCAYMRDAKNEMRMLGHASVSGCMDEWKKNKYPFERTLDIKIYIWTQCVSSGRWHTHIHIIHTHTY